MGWLSKRRGALQRTFLNTGPRDVFAPRAARAVGVVSRLVRITRVALAAVIALVLAGCGGDDGGDATEPRVSPKTTTEAQAPPDTTPLPPKPSPDLVQALRRDAVTWASLFADMACNKNKYMGQQMCERIGSVSAAFQKSFANATVEGIEHKRMAEVGPPAGSIYVADVTFSNGVVVAFGGGRPEAVPPAESCPGPGRGSGRCVWILQGPDQNRRFIQAATG